MVASGEVEEGPALYPVEGEEGPALYPVEEGEGPALSWGSALYPVKGEEVVPGAGEVPAGEVPGGEEEGGGTLSACPGPLQLACN